MDLGALDKAKQQRSMAAAQLAGLVSAILMMNYIPEHHACEARKHLAAYNAAEADMAVAIDALSRAA